MRFFLSYFLLYFNKDYDNEAFILLCRKNKMKK